MLALATSLVHLQNLHPSFIFHHYLGIRQAFNQIISLTKNWSVYNLNSVFKSNLRFHDDDASDDEVDEESRLVSCNPQSPR